MGDARNRAQTILPTPLSPSNITLNWYWLLAGTISVEGDDVNEGILVLDDEDDEAAALVPSICVAADLDISWVDFAWIS